MLAKPADTADMPVFDTGDLRAAFKLSSFIWTVIGKLYNFVTRNL